MSATRDKEVVIDMRGSEPSEIVWATFYADCEHEIDCHTEGKGSPYTLVCRKNRSGHEKDLKRYAEDLIEMKRLVAAAPESQQENVKRLNDALAYRD